MSISFFYYLFKPFSIDKGNNLYTIYLGDFMNIRNALPEEAQTIKEIYENAKLFMRASGNMHQWSGDYPELSLISRDIADKNCYICEQEGEISGVFCLFKGPDKTYNEIFGGSWKTDGDYYVIHRIAVTKHRLGVADACYSFGLSKNGVLRIDTHRDNIPMQRSLVKNGFEYCGIIYLESGDERLAFEKIV